MAESLGMWALSRRRLAELGIRSASTPSSPASSSPASSPPLPPDQAPSVGVAPCEQSPRARQEEHGLARVEVAVLGSLPIPPRVAVVGARAATHRAVQLAKYVVVRLGRAGLGLISGGARGIDGEVHRAALRADVRQGVVLPLHLSTPYPPEHEGLFRDVASRGDGIVCPLREGGAPGRWAFVARNRWLVALSDRVVVVEAARRSGSMHTGSLALASGRGVASFAGSPGGDALIAGGAVCLGHLADPPGATLDARLDAFLRGDGERDARSPTWPPHLAELRALVGDRHGFTLPDVGPRHFPAVLDAESRGLVVRVDAVRWAPVGIARGVADQGEVDDTALASPPEVSSKGPNP